MSKKMNTRVADERFNLELASTVIIGFEGMNVSADIVDITNGNLSASYSVWVPREDEYGPHEIICHIPFQHGPVGEHGRNGITEEALLEILANRLMGHQDGEFPSDDNEEALQHIRHAQECLNRRTKDREKRGVEGTSRP